MRHHPTDGCLDGGMIWIIQQCSVELDSSCIDNTMWREDCGWVWGSWSTCSKTCGEGESKREKSICKSGIWPGQKFYQEIFCPPENRPESSIEIKKCQLQECEVEVVTTVWEVTPIWAEWSEWSTCQAGWTTYLGITKSEIPSSEDCVAGTMTRKRYCWEELPICDGLVRYKYEPIIAIDDEVKLSGEIYNRETKLCYAPQCEWAYWSDCEPVNTYNMIGKRTRGKYCGYLCQPICDPTISTCEDIQQEKCNWQIEEDRMHTRMTKKSERG